MGKRKLQIKASAAIHNAKPVNSKSSPITKPVSLHRGRKKRLDAKRRYEEKRNFIQTELDKINQQKRNSEARRTNPAQTTNTTPTLAILSDIRDALPMDTTATLKPDIHNMSVVGHTKRKRVLEEESKQMRNVQQHKAYRSNPMEALRQHLMNTVSNDPSAIPPPLEPGMAGASKTKTPTNDDTHVNNAKLATSSRKRGPDAEALEKMREEAKERVARKRAEKAAYADAAEKINRRKKGGKITKQTLTGLLGRQAKSRGRIGVKRPKI